MRPVLLSLLYAFAVPSFAADPSIHLAKDPAVLSIFADVLRLGGAGYRETERAAFLVIDETGHYRCLDWPFRNGHQRQVFGGDIPPFTVAIVHTHPKSSRRPSPADARTATALGVPVFVLTPRDVWVATPEGESVPVVTNEPWPPPSSPGACGAARPLTPQQALH